MNCRFTLRDIMWTVLVVALATHSALMWRAIADVRKELDKTDYALRGACIDNSWKTYVLEQRFNEHLAAKRTSP